MYQEKKIRPIYVVGPIIAIILIVALLAVVDYSISNKKSEEEESREATDVANIRSAYAEVVTDYLTNLDETVTVTVYAQQNIKGWQMKNQPYMTYMAQGETEYYYIPASTKGYVVGIEIYGDGLCRPVVTPLK